MSETNETFVSGFFNSVEDDRTYNAVHFANYFGVLVSDGVFPNPSTNMQVLEHTGMKVKISKGMAWIKAYFAHNMADYTLSIEPADGTLKRIDRIVLRLDLNSRLIKPEVIKGKFGTLPVAPTLVRNDEIHDIALADVYVANGTTAINQGMITDQRLNKDLCGLVHALINQVDTTTIFNQYQSWFNQYSTGKALEFQEWQTRVTSELEAWIQAEELDFTAWKQDQELTFTQWSDSRKDAFDVWFATIRGILDEEAAGNIMNVINDHKDSPVPHKYYDEGLAQPMLYGLKRNAELDTPAFVYGATEAGPHDVINLPSYEQVEGMKDVVITTGGMLADVDGKMYKGVMSDYIRFTNFYQKDGKDGLAGLKEDFETKYPDMAKVFNITEQKRTYWKDNKFIIRYLTYVVFVDMTTFKVLSATNVSHIHYVYPIDGGAFWFEDTKYLYLKAKPNTNNVMSFAVFDKNTMAFVTAIRPVSSNPGAQWFEQTTVGEIVCIGDRFFACNGSLSNNIYAFRLFYDGTGVPSRYEFDNSGAFATSGTYPPRALYENNGALCVVWSNSNYYNVEKFTYNTASLTFVRVGNNSTLFTTINTNCLWLRKYKVDGVNRVLMQFGSGEGSYLLDANGDAMTPIQGLFSGNSEEFPVYDYVNDNMMAIMRGTATGFEQSGVFWDAFYILTLQNGKWESELLYAPGRMSVVNGAMTYIKSMALGRWAFFKDGILYASRTNVRYGPMRRISALMNYEEVL